MESVQLKENKMSEVWKDLYADARKEADRLKIKNKNLEKLNSAGSDELLKKHKEILELNRHIIELEKVRDTCIKCGCNEFLCGHNARG